MAASGSPKHTNALSGESSPYLLQHAHNPVNWLPWGTQALQKAKTENKLIIISVGYSACHWCHVMEHESFEDEAVAEIMNRHFISIKVDREERPDIDQVYMQAVQLITRQGGWPLNCIALPDGRPVYGGTYFKKDAWINMLTQLQQEFETHPENLIEYAEKLEQGIIDYDKVELNTEKAFFNRDLLDFALSKWKKDFDPEWGGPNRAPKFPLPNNYSFLLRFAFLSEDEELKKHIKLTLNKMMYGGIYDQVGGGFARYAVDAQWKVPHFEKMLYDNAQLISLYAEAYQAFGNSEYLRIAKETLAFCQNELMPEAGVFASALDADTEGEEGKFYVFTLDELKSLFGSAYPQVAEAFCLGKRSLWEHNKHILHREELSILQHAWCNNSCNANEKLEGYKQKLRNYREARVRPEIDDKCLTAWNGLMLKALADLAFVSADEKVLQLARKTAHFITQTQRKADGGLWRSYKNGSSSINGFLEDYAFAIDGLIRLYEVSGDAHFLSEANELAHYVWQHFSNHDNGMFYFTSQQDDVVIARKTDFEDNVMPSSNSVMARNLFYLAQHLNNESFANRAQMMLNNVQRGIAQYAAGFSNWAVLLTHYCFDFKELATCGPLAKEYQFALRKRFLPNVLMSFSTHESSLPLFAHRFVEHKTFYYLCQNKACLQPSETAESILEQLA